MIERVRGILTSYPKRSVTESLSEWMERKMILDKGQTAFPGKFSFKRTPYLREPANNLSIRSTIVETNVIKANQGGWSQIGYAYICYAIEYGIGPGLFVSADQQMSEDTIEQRVDPLIDNAGLRHKVKSFTRKAANKSTGDRRGMKTYGGTYFRAIGPRSEGKLRAFPARWRIEEEVDVYPRSLRQKGNTLEKSERRSDHYGPTRRDYKNSTPKTKEASQIEPAVESGDLRLYNVPCKQCGKKQPLVFANLKYDKNADGSPKLQIDPDTGEALNDPTYYECPYCGSKWKNADKYYFLRDREAGGMTLEDGTQVYAEWIPTKKATKPGVRSYKWPALYSPFRSWLDIILQWYRAKDDALLLPDFVNDVLAETWEETLQKPEPHALRARAESWTVGTIPDDVVFLTFAADIQADRVEAGLHGWARNKEVWHLAYWTFSGTTAESDAQCWRELERVMTTEYTRSDGVVLGKPVVSFIDAQYLQNVVNTFCEGFAYSPRQVDGVYPVIAKQGQSKICTTSPNDIATPLISVHDQKLKHELYTYLRRERPTSGANMPYGYVHFPETYDDTYYKQLTSEDYRKVTDKKGIERSIIDNAKQRRNEVLDVAKYNLGALHFAFTRLFELENKKRRRQHRKEVDLDWSKFWDYQERRIAPALKDKG